MAPPTDDMATATNSSSYYPAHPRAMSIFSHHAIGIPQFRMPSLVASGHQETPSLPQSAHDNLAGIVNRPPTVSTYTPANDLPAQSTHSRSPLHHPLPHTLGSGTYRTQTYPRDGLLGFSRQSPAASDFTEETYALGVERARSRIFGLHDCSLSGYDHVPRTTNVGFQNGIDGKDLLKCLPSYPHVDELFEIPDMPIAPHDQHGLDRAEDNNEELIEEHDGLPLAPYDLNEDRREAKYKEDIISHDEQQMASLYKRNRNNAHYVEWFVTNDPFVDYPPFKKLRPCIPKRTLQSTLPNNNKKQQPESLSSAPLNKNTPFEDEPPSSPVFPVQMPDTAELDSDPLALDANHDGRHSSLFPVDQYNTDSFINDAQVDGNNGRTPDPFPGLPVYVRASDDPVARAELARRARLCRSMLTAHGMHNVERVAMNASVKDPDWDSFVNLERTRT